MKDEIVFMEPAVVEFDQRGAGALDFLFDDLLGETGEIGVPNPAAGKTDKRVPTARKRQLKADPKHAIIVVLDLDVKPFAAVKDQRFDRVDHRRTVEVAGYRRQML